MAFAHCLFALITLISLIHVAASAGPLYIKLIPDIVKQLHSKRIHPTLLNVEDEKFKPVALELSTHQSTGASGEFCTSDADCSGRRNCVSDTGEEACDPEMSICLCLPRNRRRIPCSCENERCLRGDVCSNTASGTACVSVGLGLPSIVCETVEPSVPPTETGGFTGDACRRNSDCVGARACFESINTYVSPCLERSTDCQCFPEFLSDLLCRCDDLGCLEGDMCSGVVGNSACVSIAQGLPALECSK